MSSAGQAAGGVIGAVIGFFAGGPTGALYGAQLGMGIGGYIDPPKGPKIQGPRLSDLAVQTSTYGAFIPRIYGTVAQTGNVFWLENNQLKEVAKTESQGGSKGGGGGAEVTSYTYYATFAVGLCDTNGVPIAGIRRIWIGSKLFYDAGSADIGTLAASNEASPLFKLYTGTETQLPDPRMQATLGVANTPAYRGLAYLVFYDLPLADYQNSLAGAQIKVEVVGSGTMTYSVTQTASISADDWHSRFAIVGNYLYAYSAIANKLNVFNIANPAKPFFVSFATSVANVQDLERSGNYIYTVDQSGNLYTHNISVRESPVVYGSTVLTGGVNPQKMAVDGSYLYIANYGQTVLPYNGTLQIFDIATFAPILKSTLFFTERAMDVAIYGNYAYVIFQDADLQIVDISNKSAPVVIASFPMAALATNLIKIVANFAYITTSVSVLRILDLIIPTSPVARGNCAIPAAPYALVWENNYIYMVTGPATANGIAVFNVANPDIPFFAASAPGGHQFDGITVKNNYIFIGNSFYELKSFFFAGPLIASVSPALSAIVQAECLASKLLTTTDIDTVSLTSTVRGYRVSSLGAIRGGLEPLQGAWPFDAVQAGYKIKFIPRGQASVATISVGKLDARAAGNKPGVQIKNIREMDSVLPRKVSIKYFDSEREYDNGEQQAERLNTDAVNILTLEMAIVFTATEALQKADVLLYLYWLERYDITLNLPPEYNNLEPADVITIVAADATYILRLTAITYTADSRLECNAKYNNAATYISPALGASGQSTGVTLTSAGPTLFELLDIPLIQDAFNLSGYPVAMTGYLSGWPGGVLYRSDDGGATWTSVQGFTPPGSKIGYATNTLAAHSGLLIDKAGTLTVKMYQGALSSVTELQMLNGTNHFAYGADGRWEMVAAKNCVIQGDGSYILTDFLRGRFGTEWATGLHAINDKIIYLSSTQLKFVLANTSTIGAARSYRGITAGKPINSDATKLFTYRGVNLKSLSPVYINGNRHPTTNDWTLTWVRRTRLGNGWYPTVMATLGESVESYETEIYDAAGYATVKRTILSSTPTLAYTSAQQVTDFGSNQATLYVKIYQMSDIVGRGYPLKTSITR